MSSTLKHLVCKTHLLGLRLHHSSRVACSISIKKEKYLHLLEVMQALTNQVYLDRSALENVIIYWKNPGQLSYKVVKMLLLLFLMEAGLKLVQSWLSGQNQVHQLVHYLIDQLRPFRNNVKPALTLKEHFFFKIQKDFFKDPRNILIVCHYLLNSVLL